MDVLEKSRAFLGVERSLTGRLWYARGGEDPQIARTGLMLAQRLGLPEIVGRLIAARGVPAEEAERFLSPTLKSFLPDPSLFRDMDKAAARIVAAVCNSERIAIFGDYDVDGATSSALLARFLSSRNKATPSRNAMPTAARWPWAAPSALSSSRLGLTTAKAGGSAASPM